VKCGFENQSCASEFVRLAREATGEVPRGNLRALRTHLVEHSGVPRRSLTDMHLLAGLQVVSRLTKYGAILTQHNNHDAYFSVIQAQVVVPLFLNHGLLKAEKAVDARGSGGAKGKQYLCVSFA